MFYCINCSEIHHEKHPNDKVFKNGFYIDPFLGDRYHLGMCTDAQNHETGELLLATKKIRHNSIYYERITDTCCPNIKHKKELAPQLFFMLYKQSLLKNNKFGFRHR